MIYNIGFVHTLSVVVVLIVKTVISVNISTPAYDSVFMKRIYAEYKAQTHAGLPELVAANDGEQTHFVFSSFEQPTGNNLFFDVKLINGKNHSNVIVIGAGSSLPSNPKGPLYSDFLCFERVICNPVSHMSHFPHAAQVLFPCWSALRHFPTSKRGLITNIDPTKKGWNNELISLFVAAGVKILVDTEPMSGECDWVIAPFIPNSAWQQAPTIETLKYHEGKLLPNRPEYIFISKPTNYFSGPADVAALQRFALGSEYYLNKPDQNKKILVLILNRKYTRRIKYHTAIVKGLKSSPFSDAIEIEYVDNMKGPLKSQATIMHRADIVISPHGAQLTNLVFIKPCTVVAELFPNGYYLNFFQSYVFSAGGISFEGYEDHRSKQFDTLGIQHAKLREMRRSKDLLVSASSIVRALPRFIREVLLCRAHAVTP